MIDDSSALKWKKQHFHLNQNRSNFSETAKPEQKINNTKSLHAEQSLAGELTKQLAKQPPVYSSLSPSVQLRVIIPNR